MYSCQFILELLFCRGECKQNMDLKELRKCVCVCVCTCVVCEYACAIVHACVSCCVCMYV